ncbi:MAG: hypothetical protein A2V65_11090 [Deltaproteobacteria bacterium RBG_13_49_15]|nr:MAG: hypothetical protein A2V65_11090 [Deltaproteobacteria bacterium RBG_13_49_15]
MADGVGSVFLRSILVLAYHSHMILKGNPLSSYRHVKSSKTKRQDLHRKSEMIEIRAIKYYYWQKSNKSDTLLKEEDLTCVFS